MKNNDIARIPFLSEDFLSVVRSGLDAFSGRSYTTPTFVRSRLRAYSDNELDKKWLRASRVSPIEVMGWGSLVDLLVGLDEKDQLFMITLYQEKYADSGPYGSLERVSYDSADISKPDGSLYFTRAEVEAHMKDFVADSQQEFCLNDVQPRQLSWLPSLDSQVS